MIISLVGGAARRAEAQLKTLDEDDDEAFAKLKDVLARCLLNVAHCCKKRNGRRDEIAVLDGALGVLGDDVDEAVASEVEAAMSSATVLLRAKARLRRGPRRPRAAPTRSSAGAATRSSCRCPTPSSACCTAWSRPGRVRDGRGHRGRCGGWFCQKVL